MPFVNEFASKEDIEKYDLEGLMDKYRPIYKGKQFELSPPKITIDRERNVFYMNYRRGTEEHQNRTSAILWWDKQCVIVEIDLVPGHTGKYHKGEPLKLVKRLAGYFPQEGFDKPRDLVIEVLKEALTVFGVNGAGMQVPNTIVEFKSGALSWD